mmetsp:Transcript_9823/g.17710  ORF Transcript_9823/g.17710 Transcript_9823/m.17710 type:complete len:188 (-) Transcript_9823:707-1270(-)|eukprot:CAMPEP_0182442738 /NCGR_PEP_ID=MMETSP1172-20130603/1631_1 /TAXON_ID=708627 /ORGANISM="Timspurckia oligopyrenoides, Strain CCMP3278" /LENGTH=187 /DNA_ID=CAMNT_0024637755 /DNA_START=67 /DNA_END=630 /DNA_ORIENTATION=-
MAERGNASDVLLGFVGVIGVRNVKVEGSGCETVNLLNESSVRRVSGNRCRGVLNMTVSSADNNQWGLWGNDSLGLFDSDIMAKDPLCDIAPTIMKFMNREHVQDILEYAAKYTDILPDKSEVEHVEICGLNMYGLCIELILCKTDDDRCVCLRSNVNWPENKTCSDSNDVINALSRLSIGCGLSGDF